MSDTPIISSNEFFQRQRPSKAPPTWPARILLLSRCEIKAFLDEIVNNFQRIEIYGWIALFG
jgi:hypothetical protein